MFLRRFATTVATPSACRGVCRAACWHPRLVGAGAPLARHARFLCASPSDGRKPRRDATAAKPSAVCDPYDNKGEPLSEAQCAEYKAWISDAWSLSDDHTSLEREIEVDNFMRGAKLLTTIAAVAFNDGHFPLLTLDRRVGRGRMWQEVVKVQCRTVVLGGLSYRDFELALKIDLELERPEHGLAKRTANK